MIKRKQAHGSIIMQNIMDVWWVKDEEVEGKRMRERRD
jgi:hypothetical protein